MHKFIIVGHPQSGYQEVENLLYECGMGKANPSRREGLLPDQISDMLRQAHGTPALTALTSAEQIEQIGTAPVWHGMAMDLMLGNLDQRFWGWSDPGAIHLLEYWKQLDPTINFVFVYADPQSALVSPGADEALSVEAKLSNWQAFNAAMLHFYNRNPKRSVLVQAEQVRHSVRAYLQQLRTQLNAPLQEPPAHLLPHADQSDALLEAVASEAAEAGEGAGGELVAQEGAAVPSLHGAGMEGAADESALLRFVAGHCIAQHPPVVQLYEELQAVANLPFELGMLAAPADAAWVALQLKVGRAELQRATLREQDDRLAALQQQAEAQRLELEQVGKDVEGKRQSLAKTESRIGELTSELERLRAELESHAETKEENELLLNQLHQVQEELERLFLGKQGKQKALDTVKAERDKLAEQLKASTKGVEDSRKRIASLSAELDTVRRRLAQRDALAKENASRLAKMESAVSENAFLRAQLKGAAKEKASVLARLHKAQEALEAHYLGRKPLRAAKSGTKDAKLVGAAQRVQQQLTYRLGATMIQRSRSFGGWLGMPFALMGTARQYRADMRARGETKLPPIERYADAHDAQRVKQHLSYRLGTALLQNVKSPIGWMRLPWVLRREVKAHRMERKNRKRNA